jgi:hypothetical protein
MTRPSLALLLALSVLLVPRFAHAHFVLKAPACYSQQSSAGLPLKSAPCGQADPGAQLVPTGQVTALSAGSTVTVTIQEVIFHPGHYRVALARDQASLPPDPPVTAGSTPCGSTVIESSPTLPLLVDGALLHTAPFSGLQSFTVTIPAGMSCDHCVLQVVEFMSDHGLNNPGGCFYHHCAVVSIVPPGSTDAGTHGDASELATPDASSVGQNPPPSGCSCHESGAPLPRGLAYLTLLIGLCFGLRSGLAHLTRHIRA